MKIINGEYVLDNLDVRIGKRISINTAFMINPNITINHIKINGKNIILESKMISLFELLLIKLRGDIYG